MSVIIREGGRGFILLGKKLKLGAALMSAVYCYQYGSVDFKRLSKNIIIKDKPVLGDWLVGLLIIVYRFSRECPTNTEPVKDCFRVGSALLTI